MIEWVGANQGMNQIYLILLACYVAFFWSGCGTIGGTKQLISVDSTPRGATVFLKGEQEPIGITPFFHQMSRVPSDSMEFRYSETESVNVDINCRYRWLLEGVGNGSLLLIFPPAALAALTIDLTTGAAFDCGSSVTSTGSPSKTPATQVVYCKKYLVAPPENTDEEISDRIADLWIEKAIFSLRGCDEIIDYQSGRRSLEYVNITHRTPMGIDKMGREKLNEAAQSLAASHIVILKHSLTGDSLIVSPTILDLHTLKEDSSTAFQKVAANGSQYNLSGTESVLRYSVSLFPNSITFGRTNSNDTVVAREGWDKTNDENASRVPTQISGWGLTSIEHSAGYENWETEASLYPTLAVNYMSKNLTVLDLSTNVEKSRELKFLHLVPLYHAGYGLHTPVGAFIIDVGAGLTTVFMKVTNSPATARINPATSFGLTYRAFVTKNLFLQTGVVSYLNGLHTISAGPVTVMPAQQVAVFQAGYFIPEIRQRFRHIMGWRK